MLFIYNIQVIPYDQIQASCRINLRLKSYTLRWRAHVIKFHEFGRTVFLALFDMHLLLYVFHSPVLHKIALLFVFVFSVMNFLALFTFTFIV
jgi:hypothetical protein